MRAKRGSRWAVYAYDPATKGKRYIGTRDTEREARDLEAEHRKRRHRPKGEETCDHFATRWPDDYPRRRQTTVEHNRERVKLFAEDFKGVRLYDIDRPVARKWALANPGRYPAVRAMFTDAKNDGLVEYNPFEDLRIPGSKGRKGIVTLTERELGALADTAILKHGELLGRELRALILWCGYTAMGPAETFALERADLHGDLVDLRRLKVDVDRPVTIPPPAREALDALPSRHDLLVFCSPSGQPWTNGSWRYYWDPIRTMFTASLPAEHWLPRRRDDEGKPKPLTMYELRHCAATMLLERGVSPSDAAVQLGHTDGGVLVQTLYGHPSEDGARSRLLAAWGVDVGTSPPPTPIRSGQSRGKTIEGTSA